MKESVQRAIPIYTFCLYLVIITHSTQAQEYVDIVKLNYNYSSLNTFENSEEKSTIKELDLELTIPIIINNKMNFITGLYGEAINAKLFSSQPSTSVYSISPKLGLNISHSEKWSGTYMFLPKIASDFKTITHDDFQFGGFALFKYTKSNQLNYKIGIYGNTEFFGPWIVPLFGLYYTSPNKKFEANLTLPFFADVNFSLPYNMKVGINFIGQTKSYYLSTLPGREDGGYVARATTELYGYAGMAFSKSIHFQVKAGHSFGRYYRVYDSSEQVSLGIPLQFFGDDRQQVNTDFTDGWIFQAMFIYRYNLESN